MQKNKRLLITLSLLPFLYLHATVYEDSEDGKTTKWYIYDDAPRGAKLLNLYDNELNSKVIKFEGYKQENGIRFIGWNDTQNSIVEWKMKADSEASFYIVLETKKGSRYLFYSAKDSDEGVDPKQRYKIRFGLGSKLKDGEWHTYTRDIVTDLKKFEPDNELISIDGVKIRGSFLIDDIKLIKKVETSNLVEHKDNSLGFIDNLILYTKSFLDLFSSSSEKTSIEKISIEKDSIEKGSIEKKPIENMPTKKSSIAKNSTKTLITLKTLKAFPTAEGAGAIASGGRGGEVVYVTNRRATGTGSLQWALAQPFKRTIVFAVGGRFNLDKGIKLGSKKHDNNPNVDYKLGDFTLAGQTANDKGGVHLANNIELINYRKGAKHFDVYNQKNMILRYFDSRFNWSWYPKKGKLGKEPSIRFSYVSDLILDHITSGWSSYGLIVSNSNVRSHERTLGNITIQRSLFHENIVNPDRSLLMKGVNPKQYQRVHNTGLLLGKDPGAWKYDKVKKVVFFRSNMTKTEWSDMGEFSIHKNAFIGLTHRFPNTSGGEGGKFRFSNNYIYGFDGDNTGQRLARVAGIAQNDIVGNLYQRSKYSPDFNRRNLYGYLDNETFDGHISKANLYIRDNLFLNNDESIHPITKEINNNPLLMFHNRLKGNNKHNKGKNLTPKTATLRKYPIQSSAYPVSLLPVSELKDNLLSNIGGNVQFDSKGVAHIEDPIDRLYISWAKKNGGPDHITTMEDGEDRKRWGVGNSKRFVYPKEYNVDIQEDVNASLLDYDLDGMPDLWEEKHHLSSKVKNNNAVHKKWEIGNYIIDNQAKYTDLEIYLADIGGDFHMLANQKK